jgi:hypothetical protein
MRSLLQICTLIFAMDSATAIEMTETIAIPNLYFPPVTNISIFGVAADGVTTYGYYVDSEDSMSIIGMSLLSSKCQW